jgi:hypothetical protein
MGISTFSGPVVSTNGFTGDVTTGTYTVATLPAAASSTGSVLFASDALKASETTGNGTGNLVFSDGSDWIRVDTGAAAGS